MIDVALALALVAPAGATGPSVTWRASGGCDGAAAVGERVAALVGGDRSDATIAVEISESGDGLVASVAVTTADHEVTRTITASSCEGLRAAVAVVAAVQLDVVGVAQAPAMQRVVVPSPPPVTDVPATPREDRPPVVRAPPPAAARVTTAPRGLRFAIWIGGGAALRTLPAAATAIGGGAALHIRRARVTLDAVGLLDRVARLPAPDDDAGAEIGLRGGSLRAGWVPTFRQFEFPLLVGVEAGDMTARGVGVRRARVRHGGWAAALAGVGIAWSPIPAFAIALDPAVAIALGRPTFGVDAPGGLRRLFQPPRVGARVGLRLEVRFL